MFVFVIIFLLLVSVLMALWSLRKQGRLDEVHSAKKELNRGKVIFHRESAE